MGRERKYERCTRYPDGKHRWKDGAVCYCGYRRSVSPTLPVRVKKQSRVVRLDADLLTRIAAIDSAVDVREAIERVLMQWLKDRNTSQGF
jgi:ABC-type Mn2+/Zn2+ transport system ATPase subunit